MSRVAVVSRLWDFQAKKWLAPELLLDFGPDDQHFAESQAVGEWRKRLEELVKMKKGLVESLLPWREEIVVCPLISGIGRGGSDFFAIDDRSLTYTIGIE